MEGNHTGVGFEAGVDAKLDSRASLPIMFAFCARAVRVTVGVLSLMAWRSGYCRCVAGQGVWRGRGTCVLRAFSRSTADAGMGLDSGGGGGGG